MADFKVKTDYASKAIEAIGNLETDINGIDKFKDVIKLDGNSLKLNNLMTKIKTPLSEVNTSLGNVKDVNTDLG